MQMSGRKWLFVQVWKLNLILEITISIDNNISLVALIYKYNSKQDINFTEEN